jgi:hypothetical protein
MWAKNIKGQYNWGIDLSHFPKITMTQNFYMIITGRQKKVKKVYYVFLCADGVGLKQIAKINLLLIPMEQISYIIFIDKTLI